MSGSGKIRKFERFLFKGVPEQLESVFERDGYSLIDMRKSGLSASIDYNKQLEEGQMLIGTYVYDFEEKKETYTPNQGDGK